MSVLGSLIAAGTSIATGLGSQAISRKNAELAAARQFDYQKKLMALQNQVNMENWNAQAAYNSVGAQVARMKAAGLSPTLIYGSGADGGIASAAPEVDTAPIDYSIQDPNLSGAINSGISVYKAASELENLESQTDLVKAKTLSEMMDVALKNKDYEYYDQLKAIQMDLLRSTTEKNRSDVLVNSANVKKIEADTKYRELVSMYYPQVIGQSLAESSSRIQLNSSQIREIDSKIRVNSKLCAKMDAEIAKMAAEIELIASQKDLSDAEFLESRKRCEKMDSEIRKMASEIGLNDMELQYYIWNHPRTSNFFGVRWNNSSADGKVRDKLSPTISNDELLMFVRERFGEEAAAQLGH